MLPIVSRNTYLIKKCSYIIMVRNYNVAVSRFNVYSNAAKWDETIGRYRFVLKSSETNYKRQMVLACRLAKN